MTKYKFKFWSRGNTPEDKTYVINNRDEWVGFAMSEDGIIYQIWTGFWANAELHERAKRDFIRFYKYKHGGEAPTILTMNVF